MTFWGLKIEHDTPLALIRLEEYVSHAWVSQLRLRTMQTSKDPDDPH